LGWLPNKKKRLMVDRLKRGSAARVRKLNKMYPRNRKGKRLVVKLRITFGVKKQEEKENPLVTGGVAGNHDLRYWGEVTPVEGDVL